VPTTAKAWPDVLLSTSNIEFGILCTVREMLHFERLQALHAVATFGSVTGAATALHLTPSAVSQQLAKLQRDVGQRLVEPYGRGVRLTSAGTLLARRAHAILSEVESAENELDRQRNHVVGDLEIAGFATAARAILPQSVARLSEEHQQLRLRVSERQPDEAIRLVAAGHLDIALVNDWMNAPLVLPDGVEQLLIMNDAVDLALPAGHPLAKRTSVEITELSAEPWITWPYGAICHEWLTQTLRQHGVTPEVAHTAEEHQTQLAMVAAGLGIAVMPRLGRGATDGVSIISLQPAFSRQIYAIWRTLASERPAIAVTVSAIREVAHGLTDG
jgi:DNA-binding transcriptional LysR family regulator